MLIIDQNASAVADIDPPGNSPEGRELDQIKFDLVRLQAHAEELHGQAKEEMAAHLRALEGASASGLTALAFAVIGLLLSATVGGGISFAAAAIPLSVASLFFWGRAVRAEKRVSATLDRASDIVATINRAAARAREIRAEYGARR